MSKDYLRVKIRGMTPPNGFRYTFSQDGVQVHCGVYEDFLLKVKQHYQRNGYAMPEDWAEQAEDQCCRLMPAGVCMYGDGSEPEFIINNRFSFDDVVNGTKTLAAWVAIPFGPETVLANVNAGLLLIMAITSIEVYGVIIAGWASNSKYAFLGALRASAQMVSYEIAMGFALVVVLMVSARPEMK